MFLHYHYPKSLLHKSRDKYKYFFIICKLVVSSAKELSPNGNNSLTIFQCYFRETDGDGVERD